jgi:O-antigen/teichoic acid export membrane protein
LLHLKNFFSGHARSVKAKKNIIASIIIKGSSIVIGLLMVRVTLDYLDQTRYGIWLTLASFLTWFTFFEIGLGNGLRNKLAEALAVKDFELGKIYVSTTYAILLMIISTVAVIFFALNYFIDWTVVLNTDRQLADELNYIAAIVFGFFFLRFIVKLISVILYADQRPAVANLFGPLGNFMSLVLVYILTITTESSLIYLAWVLSVVPVAVLILSSIYFFKTDYKAIAPSVKSVRFRYAKELFTLGTKFFVIQIAGLIIYQSSNIIIAQFFGPAEVTTYNIAFKYFSIINMGFSIIIMPFWSAFTEAWVKKDIGWIRNITKKILYIWSAMSLGGIIMLIISEPVYEIWVGSSVKVPFLLSFTLLIYFVSFTFSGVFNTFINGVGKIKLQMYSAFFAAIIFIGTAIMLISVFEFGIISIVVAMILSNFYGLILAPVQYKKIINFKAHGIWNK